MKSSPLPRGIPIYREFESIRIIPPGQPRGIPIYREFESIRIIPPGLPSPSTDREGARSLKKQKLNINYFRDFSTTAYGFRSKLLAKWLS